MKRSLAVIVLGAGTLAAAGLYQLNNAPGIYPIVIQQDKESFEDIAFIDHLDPTAAGAYAYGSESSDFQEDLNESNERLYEEIYLAQLYEELQLMNDYEELLTALNQIEENKKAAEIQKQEQHDHDYHEVMHAYSYHRELDHVVAYLNYREFLSDYDELLNALAMKEIDPKAFDLRFSDSTIQEDAAPESDDKIDFVRLTPDQKAALQEEMEKGELAEVDRVLRNRSR